MFTFYIYLAFIHTRNVKSLSNKHLRLILLILIYLTSNYGLTYATSHKFLNCKIFNVFKEAGGAERAAGLTVSTVTAVILCQQEALRERQD